MKQSIFGAAAAVVFAAASPAEAAPLIGDTITCTATGFTCSTTKAVVGAGTEFTGSIGFPMPFLSFDFSSNMLTIRNPAGIDYGTTFNVSYAFQDLDKAFTDVTLMTSNGFSNLSQSNFTISNGALGFATSTFFSASQNATLTLRLGTADAGAVPEPASWAMIILGTGAIGLAMRRRRKITARVSYVG